MEEGDLILVVSWVALLSHVLSYYVVLCGGGEGHGGVGGGWIIERGPAEREARWPERDVCLFKREMG